MIKLKQVLNEDFNSLLYLLRKEQYYKIGNIKYTKKYKFDEMLKNIVKYKNYGPWDNKIYNVEETNETNK